MTNAVAVFNPSANVPAFARTAEISELTKALAGGGGGGFGKRISIKGGTFRLIVDGKQVAAIEERYLDVVIVNAAPQISRTYYQGSFSEDSVQAPTCWSADGTTPHKDCKTPQAPSCAGCPMNEKGSGQGETRACRHNQRIAVVLANDIDGDVMQLQLAATSIFGKEHDGLYPLQAYARFLAAQNINANMVITRMKFDLSDASYPKLTFKAMRWLEADEYASAEAQGKTPEAQQAITMTVAQVDGVKAKAEAAAPPQPKPEEEAPPPAPKAKRAKPAPAPEPEAAPEPTVRRDPEPAAAPKSDLASLVDEWDD